MKLNKKLRRQLAEITSRYSRWCTPKEIGNFWDELLSLGIVVPMWDIWSEDHPHPFEIDGVECEDSLLVFRKHEGEILDEYTIYFS